ncbi:hypothetical protein [Deinococcus aestuarii]|uniref:hypothetical protein n=1 Tax=Deinococcus aestuarii TaxID=2774531 RepID=UPI001C0ABD4E|nr:hypothetical protein [Deinococcus aestuarii]
MPYQDLDVLRRAVQEQFGGFGAQMSLLPNQKPQSCPAPLPSFEELGLVGSLENVSPSPDGYSAWVFFEPVLQVEEAERTLRANLEAAGWEGVRPTFPRPAGFLPEVEPDWTVPPEAEVPQMFVHHAARSVAFIQTQEHPEGVALALRIDRGHAYTHHAGPPGGVLLQPPRLPAPSRVTVRLLGGGSGASNAVAYTRSTALVLGPGTTLGLHAHYAGELERQGWKRAAEVGEDALRTSTWHVPEPGGETRGTLVIAQLETGRWHGQLEVMQLRPDDTGSEGWSTYSF